VYVSECVCGLCECVCECVVCVCGVCMVCVCVCVCVCGYNPLPYLAKYNSKVNIIISSLGSLNSVIN
jgi:Na+/H+-dicarboxylate symporter